MVLSQSSTKKLKPEFESLNLTSFTPVINNNIINYHPVTHSIQDNNNVNPIENLNLKNKYLEALNKGDNKRHFQVYYVFKNKIKRMYRVDCMTRKINV
jgi:hypothetical protein